MSAEKYVRYSVENVEQNLSKYTQRPDTDTLPKLKSEGVIQYREVVRVIR